ncbi:monooxygenase [Salmonella enterica]|nr:monooxygenase [Salmonella enterica]EIY7071100.1 monooxygenase [Salmonella enterica]
MSKTLLQIHFNFSGPFGEDMTQQLVGLAESINEEPGFIWKIWTESEKNQQAGGIYLFESEETAQAYIKKHTARLKNLGVDEVTFKLFGVNDALTKINHGNLGR